MKVEEIVARARALYDQMPVRKVSSKTAEKYRREFARIWNIAKLDLLAGDVAMDTYYVRRAALHFVGREVLAELILKIDEAHARRDCESERDWASKLLFAVSRLEAALELDPPLPTDSLPWKRQSRWRESGGNGRKRGAGSKKHTLQHLPRNWDQRLWDAVPEHWRHRDALAIHLTLPLRPEDLVPGERPSGWSSGVIVERKAANRINITFAPAKSQDGLYGTGVTTVTINPKLVGEPACFLGARCDEVGGKLVVSTPTTNPTRKAVEALGRKALPEISVRITPSVARHQILADLKATFGSGEQVTTAAGHCTDRTDSKYGYIQHGRKRKGYVVFKAERTPRMGNTARARSLGQRKQTPR